MSVLVRNGPVLTGGLEPHVLSGHAVLVGERIEAVGPEEELLARYPEATRLDAHGGLVMPGLVNLHHHFYSLPARGLDPGPGVTGFPEVLTHLWWRLDRALDPEVVLYASLLSLAECTRQGVTTVFDHHASPPCIKGILEVIAAAVQESGLSAVICYEVSDRNGHEEALSGLDESLRFLHERGADPRVRGAVGLHASFTLADETLREVARRSPPTAVVHVHAGEHVIDAQVSAESFGCGPLERLDDHGLLSPRALLAHGVHLTIGDLDLVARRGAVLVHNPESNAANGVGRLDVTRARAAGCDVGLGTDGMSGSILRALRAACLIACDERRDPSAGLAAVSRLLDTNAATAARALDEPLLGRIEPGAPGDVIVVDAPPPTEIHDANLTAHLAYTAAEAPVRHTIARGQVLLEDFRLRRLDLPALSRRARALFHDVHRRVHGLPAGRHGVRAVEEMIHR